MNKTIRNLSLAMTLVAASAGAALATPSTQIWIPSTDIQAYKTFHLGIDNYIRLSGVGKATGNPNVRDSNVYDIGPEVGVLPPLPGLGDKLQMEAGFDFLSNSTEPNDNHPFSGNFKIGIPAEDALFKYSPAIVVGMYNAGPTNYGKSTAPFVTSGQNIAYVLTAKTLPAIGPVPSLGRLSAGYYHGSARALVDPSGHSANDGVLLSWDRTMSEISDKLWMAVDYQGGNNVDGALNMGFSWSFAKNVSVIFAYDIYKEKALAGNNTFTTQLDINFP
ncbi:MAG TPA: hypothetical protein VF775_06245 [Geobacteraceae bacterium]